LNIDISIGFNLIIIERRLQCDENSGGGVGKDILTCRR
jgi:hypothetical protein